MPHVVESFIQDVFSNIEEIKLRHEALLKALFETQRINYHEVYSIMDDLLDAISEEGFQRLYVEYLSVCTIICYALVITDYLDRTLTML
jgi:hypothetical protein